MTFYSNPYYIHLSIKLGKYFLQSPHFFFFPPFRENIGLRVSGK